MDYRLNVTAASNEEDVDIMPTIVIPIQCTVLVVLIVVAIVLTYKLREIKSKKENDGSERKLEKTYDDTSVGNRVSFHLYRVLGIGRKHRKRSDFETVTIHYDKTAAIHVYDEPDDIDTFQQQSASKKDTKKSNKLKGIKTKDQIYQNPEGPKNETFPQQEKVNCDLDANDESDDSDEIDGCTKNLPQYTNTTLRGGDYFEVSKADTENAEKSQHLYLGLESGKEAEHEQETHNAEYTNTVLKD